MKKIEEWKKGERGRFQITRGITPSLRRSPNTSPRGFIRRRRGSNKIQNSKYNVHIIFPWSSIMSVGGDNGGLQRNRRRDRAPTRPNTYDLRPNNSPSSHDNVRRQLHVHVSNPCTPIGWTEKLRKSWKKKKYNTFDIEKKNLRLFKRIFEYTILTSILLITNTCTNIPILRGKFVAFRKEISLSILGIQDSNRS